MRPRLAASPWAVLALALLFYVSDGQIFFLCVLPILCHEAGHALALRLCGCRITELRLCLSGLSLRYTGTLPPGKQALCAFAGPLAGLFYAAAAARFGSDGALSAGISLLLSAFNLIPAPPLDGAQIASALLGERAACVLAWISAGAVLLAGVWLWAAGRGAGLALAGVFLLCDHFKSSAKSPD